jgi:hypothetical protein
MMNEVIDRGSLNINILQLPRYDSLPARSYQEFHARPCVVNWFTLRMIRFPDRVIFDLAQMPG